MPVVGLIDLVGCATDLKIRRYSIETQKPDNLRVVNRAIVEEDELPVGCRATEAVLARTHIAAQPEWANQK